MLVSQLEGAKLDFWVAKAEGHEIVKVDYKIGDRDWLVVFRGSPDGFRSRWFPSTEWSQGGPIIERECVELWSILSKDRQAPYAGWSAKVYTLERLHPMKMGTTALIAAMRAYVASKFGEEVE